MNKFNNREIYDKNWKNWVEMKIYGPASRWLRTLIGDLLRKIDATRIKTVLDVGSGEGTTTAYLAEKLPDAKVLGIDFSESGIQSSRAAYPLKNISFKHDVNSSELNNYYDLVTSFEVLEHVPEWKELLGRMAKSSRRYLLLSFPTGRMRQFEKNVGHLRNFKKGEVEKYLENVGYKPLSIFYAGFPFYSPLYRDFCNLTNAGNNEFTKGEYGFIQKLASSAIYALFYFFSTKKKYGDQFLGLFERK
ncbi:MAG: class I SAM-dependent methyltransferase [Patescibacteria group bacterium]